MKVWLDDERDPADPQIIKGFGSSADLIWVKTVEEAIKLLETGEVTWISLDNYLGFGLREGYEVARWLEEQAALGQLKPLQVYAHTMNPVRGREMRICILNMRRYWRQPLYLASTLSEDE
jgi:hypothetical protein